MHAIGCCLARARLTQWRRNAFDLALPLPQLGRLLSKRHLDMNKKFITVGI